MSLRSWRAARRRRRETQDALRRQWATEAHETVMGGGPEGREAARSMNMSTIVEGGVALALVILVAALVVAAVVVALFGAVFS